MKGNLLTCSQAIETLSYTLSGYTGVPPSIILESYGHILADAAPYVLAGGRSSGEDLLRFLVGPVLDRLPHSIRQLATDLAKSLRSHRHSETVLDPSSGSLNRLLMTLRRNNPEVPDLWDGKSFALCLTHDVDNSVGYQFVEDLFHFEYTVGCRSTFFFLSGGDYTPGLPLLERLEQAGFEVGLHGLTHDIGLGIRSERRIQHVLREATARLGVPVRGFRAPALSVSEKLLECIEDVGFEYDSSLQVSAPFYRSTKFSMPYPYPGRSLWEVPLSLQDDQFFRDAFLSEEQATVQLGRFLKQIAVVGGAAVVNLHPHLLCDRPKFLTYVMDVAASDDGPLVLTMCSLVKRVRRFVDVRMGV